MSLLTNLISYWKLDESSGNAADSNSTNTLTNNNTTAYVAGKINNGSNPAPATGASAQGLTIVNASQSGLNITGDMSISCWWKPTSLTDNGLAGKWGAPGARSYLLYQNSDATSTVSFYVSDDGSNIVSGDWSNAGITVGNWFHLVATWKASTSKANLYINGVAQAEKTTTGITSIISTTNDFMIGRVVGAVDARSGDGIVDEVGIWSRVLTAAEALSLYNNGNGLPYPLTTSSSNFLDIL